MDSYTPACKIYTDEDFNFELEVTGIDEDTGETIFNANANNRCFDCFLQEQCVEKVRRTIVAIYDVEDDKVVNTKKISTQ